MVKHKTRDKQNKKMNEEDISKRISVSLSVNSIIQFSCETLLLDDERRGRCSGSSRRSPGQRPLEVHSRALQAAEEQSIFRFLQVPRPLSAARRGA